MYTNVCDGNMEEGSLRCDANVSMHHPGDPLGTRTEIKNVNSFRYLRSAIDFEIARQTAILESGGAITQETRLYDPAAGETRPMRSKEEAHDYRYFPDPDLPPLVIERAWVDEIARSIPELPHIRAERYQRDFAISAVDAEALVTSLALARAARSCLPSRRGGSTRGFLSTIRAARRSTSRASSTGRPASPSGVSITRIRRTSVARAADIAESRVTPPMLGRLIRLIDTGAIGGKSAKAVFDEMSTTGDAPDAIVERQGLSQISDPEVIRDAARRIIERNATQVEQYRAGKSQLFGFLVGQLMKETRGKANAEMANEILRDLLGG